MENKDKDSPSRPEDHPFFGGVDWAALTAKELPAPWRPSCKTEHELNVAAVPERQVGSPGRPPRWGGARSCTGGATGQVAPWLQQQQQQQQQCMANRGFSAREKHSLHNCQRKRRPRFMAMMF